MISIFFMYSDARLSNNDLFFSKKDFIFGIGISTSTKIPPGYNQLAALSS